MTTLQSRLQDGLIGEDYPMDSAADREGNEHINLFMAEQRERLHKTAATIASDLKGMHEDTDLHAKLRWVIAHFKTYGLTDDDGNDVETTLGDLFDPDELIEQLKLLYGAAVDRYCGLTKEDS